MNHKADLIRKRYLYRRLILSGDVHINRHTAKKLIGPDCAYHLYSRAGSHPQERKGLSCSQSKYLKEKKFKT